MKKSSKRAWALPLALLPTLGLLAADYTAAEVAARLDGLQPMQLTVPDEISKSLIPMDGNMMACPKCGRQMRLKTNPQLMKLLYDRVAERCGWQGLDDSSLCPHCGDGKYYVRTTERVVQSVKQEDGSVRPEVVARPAGRKAVTEEDLLLLYHLFFDKPEEKRHFSIFFRYNTLSASSGFIVKTEDAFRELLNRCTQFIQKDSARTGYDGKASLARMEKECTRLEENAAIFQRLTESANILRKKELDNMLKQMADLIGKERAFKDGNYMMLTRMAILSDHPQSWTPLTCPECHAKFYVQNGTNAPHMTPLGDLLALLACLDMTPNYATLCPHCHPDGEAPRRLKVTCRLGDQAYVSELTPADLSLLLQALMRPTRPGVPAMNPSLTAGQILRLRAILQGADDTSQSSAEAVAQP